MTIVVNYVIIFILGCIYNTHAITLTSASYRIYRMYTGFILFYSIHTDDTNHRQYNLVQANSAIIII